MDKYIQKSNIIFLLVGLTMLIIIQGNDFIPIFFFSCTDVIFRLAYSCLMIMAHGLGRIVKDATDQNKTLTDLSMGQLPFEGDDMISIFNQTQFLSPQGPILLDKNGDTMTG